MRTSDPAAALRLDGSTAVAAAKLPPDVDPGTSCCNMATDQPDGTAPEPRRRWLALVTDDDPALGEDTNRSESGGASEAATDRSTFLVPAALPAVPMAAPVETVVSTLFDGPAAVVGLLETANEQRRVIDLLWSAYEMGAIQLPNALAAHIQRARDCWPTALGVLPGIPLPS